MPFSFSKVGVDRRWLAAAFAYAAVIFVVSSRPYLQPPGPEFEMKDNLAHAFEYAVLAALLFRALAALTWPDFAITFLMVVVISASVGAADEMFQGTVPGRQRDVMDWVCDTTGAALATAACMAWVRRTQVRAESAP